MEGSGGSSGKGGQSATVKYRAMPVADRGRGLWDAPLIALPTSHESSGSVARDQRSQGNIGRVLTFGAAEGVVHAEPHVDATSRRVPWWVPERGYLAVDHGSNQQRRQSM